MEEPQKTICKKCEVVPLDKTPSTLDNANMSSAERFSQRIRNTTGRKVYQGQPTHLNIYNEKFTTARISFRSIGTPAYYHIIVTSETDAKFFSVTYNEYIAYGYFEATGLIPNTLYTVNIIAHYVSGDAFPLNHKKTFSTTAAEGEVKNIQVRNPSNETFDITVPKFTNLSVSFELLNDKVDYKVILQENTTDVSIVTVSRDDVFSGNTRIVDQLDFHFPTLDFDASYSILVNSVYGNNDFTFSTSREIKTLNEDFSSSLDVSNIQNTSVDLSYNFVDVSNIVYKLYVENDLTATHANYSGIFELRELLIGQEYKNVYVSITFPESNNEYKNKIQDFSFTTLDESPSAFVDTIVRNTSIDVSFLDASGTNEVYTLLITDNNNYDFSYELSNIYFHSFVDLSINTNYDITIRTTYPPFYSDVSNTYEVSQSFTTLNEGPVTNVVHESDIDFIVFDFSGSPNFDNLVTVGYDVYLDGNNIITLDNLDVSFQINNLRMDVLYEVEILSTYPTTNNIYSYKNKFKTSIEGPVDTIDATNIQSTSIDLKIIPLGTKVKHFDISLNNVYNEGVLYNTSNEYNIDGLTQNVEYSVTVTVEYESGRRYTTSTIAHFTENTNVGISDKNYQINNYYLYDITGKTVNYVLVGGGGSGGRSGSGKIYLSTGANGGEVIEGNFTVTSDLIVSIGQGGEGIINNGKNVYANPIIDFSSVSANVGISGESSFISDETGILTTSSGGAGSFSTPNTGSLDISYNNYTYLWPTPLNLDDWTRDYGARGLFGNVTTSDYSGNPGGDGKLVTIAGINYIFGGGGGSSSLNRLGSNFVGGAGGAGGGGRGGTYGINLSTSTPLDGVPNTGGGAGGSGRNSLVEPKGGSGVAYLWYPLFTTVESLLYVISKTGNTITIGYSDNTTELYFGETNIIPLPNSNNPYTITDLTKDQSYDFSTNLATLTVKTLNESAMSLDSIGFTGNTITINNDNNHSKYDISIDPARGDGIFEFLDLTGTPFIISDLSPDTQYTINATSYYDTNNSYIATPQIITTSNEFTINVTGVEIRNTSVNIVWNIVGSVNSVVFTLDNTTATINNGITSYEFTDLSINTSYVLNITTNYSNNNSYTSTVEFTTLNEEEANVTTETFFITSGNTTIISIHNTNQNDVSENIIQIADNSYVLIGSTQLDYSMISQFDFIEGNVTTKYKEISPSGLYTYDTRDYITDFSFDAIMYKPLYKVKNDSIELEWFDISTNMDGASYNINFSSSEQLFDKDTRSFLFEDLSINTQYDISFTRNYSGTSETFFQSIETLHQGPTDPSGIIVLNSGMQGNIIVIDLSNINPTDVESNTVNVISDDISYSFTSTRTLFEFDVDIGETYLGNVVTTYVDKISDQLNILYIPDIYVSDDFSFTVQNYDQPYVVRNGIFDVGSSVVSYTDGSVLATPDEWYGESIKLGENVNTGTELGHKFIDNDAPNNVILFKNNQSNDFANLSQNYDFLFQDYYKFAYYVANNVLENQLFGSGSDKSEPNIEYQIKFISDNNTVFETIPIVSTDHNWNKFEIKFFIPQSYKNVKLRIQRNLFELNNLFLSDISMVGFGKRFDFVPFFEKNADWTPSQQSLIGDWRSLMKEDSIVTTGNVFSLSSNMTIDFWLYVHDTQLTTTDKGIFLLGDTRTEGSPYIYLQNERLVIQSKIHKKRLPFSPKLSYESKIPMHYSITFGNNKVDIYKNGTLDLSGSPNGHLRESLPIDNIYMGRPDMEILGYVTKNFKLYDFVMGESDIQTRYNNMKTTYSIVGNYYDVSENVTIIQFDDDKTTHTVNYQLHNTNNLQKTVELIAMNTQTSTLNPVIGIPFSVSFWALNTSGLIFELDGTSTSILQSDTDGVYIDSFSNVKIKSETNKLQHFMFSIDTNKITGYLNGYLYNSSILTTTPNLDINEIVLGTSGQISNIEIYNKALSQEEAFTVYHNHYHLYSEYDMSGTHKVILFNPVGNPETDVSYLITGNTFALSVPTVGTISTETKVIDISMTPIDLNNFHKNSDTFNFKLNDYNIDFEVNGVNKPFLTIINTDSTTDGTFTEFSEIKIDLSNTTETYSYEITGIDISDITTNNLTGDISNSIIVQMREDYKTEGLETMVFTIADLGIATFADISDTNTNILSINKTSANTNEEFIVTLTVPANKFVGQSHLSYSIEIEDNTLSMVDPSTNGVFDLSDRVVDKEFVVDISFDVVGLLDSKRFIITLDGTESSASLILNDIASPSITITTFFQNRDIEQTNHVVEGGTINVSISTPRSFEDGRAIPYTINGGVNTLDISSSTDPTYNNLTGSFIVNTAKAGISFVISENREPNTNNETFRITLDDFPSIFAEVVIVDTVKPITYLWSFANANGETITEINEGEVFTVTLETQGLEDGHVINYSLGGANITIDDLSTNDFTGTFTVPTDMSRNYTVRKDNRTEGDEDLTFIISIQDQPDAIRTLKINDTSQAPNYSLNRNATYRLGEEQLNIDISFSVPNRSNVDELILSRSAQYIVTGVDNSDISGDLTGFIDLIEDSVIKFEKIQNYTQKTLMFSTLDTSIQVGLNYNENNAKYTGIYNEDTNKYTLVTYGQTSDVSYQFTDINDNDLSLQLDGIDVSINGTIPSRSSFDDNYVFTLTPHKSFIETDFNIINDENTQTVGTININT